MRQNDGSNTTLTGTEVEEMEPDPLMENGLLNET